MPTRSYSTPTRARHAFRARREVVDDLAPCTPDRQSQTPAAHLQPDRVTALMPCHAEPPTEALLDRLMMQVGTVLLIGDGMPAAKARRLDALAADRGVHTAHLPRSSGKGHALLLGLTMAAADPAVDAVLAIDADGQHPPEAIPRFIAATVAGAELVVGDRLRAPRDMPLVRRVANRTASGVVAARTRAGVRDSQCGMRLLRGRALRGVQFPPGRMESETRHLIACLAAGVKVAWVDIPAIYNGAPSAFRPLRDSMAVMSCALRAF